jgi:beta-glucanase (GH16 family)
MRGKISAVLVAVSAAALGVLLAVPAHATDPTPVVPAGVTPPTTLVFDDEFAGASLDTAKWNAPCYPWGDCYNHGNTGSFAEAQCYQSGQIAEANGLLSITAQAASVTCDGTTKAWKSGLIDTRDKFTFGPGTFIETSVKLPLDATHPGMWPAFWTLPNDLSWPPEIDVLEQLGNPAKGGKVNETLHTSGGTPTDTECWLAPCSTSANWNGHTYSEAFHTFGAWWKSNGNVVWYVDGVQAASYTGNLAGTMYMLLNLAVRDAYDDPVNYPSGVLQADYVRAWQ